MSRRDVEKTQLINCQPTNAPYGIQDIVGLKCEEFYRYMDIKGLPENPIITKSVV